MAQSGKINLNQGMNRMGQNQAKTGFYPIPNCMFLGICRFSLTLLCKLPYTLMARDMLVGEQAGATLPLGKRRQASKGPNSHLAPPLPLGNPVGGGSTGSGSGDGPPITRFA